MGWWFEFVVWIGGVDWWFAFVVWIGGVDLWLGDLNFLNASGRSRHRILQV